MTQGPQRFLGILSPLGVRIALVVLVAIAGLKALRLPNPYSRSHWLWSYEHGLVKRGLVGTIFRPAFSRLDPVEGNDLILTVSALILGSFLFALLRLSRAALDRHGYDHQLTAAALVFAASPFVVYSMHLIGYYDSILGLLSIVMVWMVIRGVPAWGVGLLGVVATSTHELFMVMSFPVVVVSYVLVVDRPLRKWERKHYGQLALVTLPPLVAFVLIAWASAGLSPEDLYAIKRDVLRSGMVRHSEARPMFRALNTSLVDNWGQERRIGGDWLSIGACFSVLLWTAMSLASRRSLPLFQRVLVVLACVAPMTTHLVAWDTTRFNAMVLFNTFLVVAVLALTSEPGPATKPRPTFLVLSLIVLVVGLNAAPKLFNQREVREFPYVEQFWADLRAEKKSWEVYASPTCTPIFENSDFEKGSLEGWTAEGSAFANQPVYEDNSLFRRDRPATPQGNWYVGTYEDNPEAGKLTGKVHGDKHMGELRSPEFTIEQPQIHFLVGGGKQRSVYVALEVEGTPIKRRRSHFNREEMARASFNVSAHVGKKAQIVIVDQSSSGWGHINADAFCYGD